MGWAIIPIILEFFGIAAAIHAVLSVRTDRGTIAWCIALISLPFFALPFYVVFGRTRFDSYRRAIREAQDNHEDQIIEIRKRLDPFRVSFDENPGAPEAVLEKLSPYRFTSGNKVRLLVDGEETFEAIFKGIEVARHYILVQFYTIEDDALGRRLRDALLERARAGVSVRVLYDEIGSSGLTDSYIETLVEGGVAVGEFGTQARRASRFEVNFRNHRKIVIVDGRVAFVGGHNVSDEYLGKSEWAGPWRDTHLRIEGPAVKHCQMVFMGDWYWTKGDLPEFDWEIPESDLDAIDSQALLVLPSGPSQKVEICSLAYIALINSARERCWIASPYFVPDEAILSALKFAALRGVDVRIMIPAKRDHWLVWLAAYSFLEEMDEAGVRMLRYTKGFLHQKTFLVDRFLAGVGTANLDQRSFRLNFEVNVIGSGGPMVDDVERMFVADFENCLPAPGSEFSGRSFWFRLMVRVARLFAPVL